MAAFSENLRRLRKEKGLTRQFMANELGVSQAAYGYYETNDGFPTVERVMKIANILGVSVDELLNHKEDDFERFKAEWSAAGFEVEELEDGRIMLKNTFSKPAIDATEKLNSIIASNVFGFSRQTFIEMSANAHKFAQNAFIGVYQNFYHEIFIGRTKQLIDIMKKNESESELRSQLQSSSPAAVV